MTLARATNRDRVLAVLIPGLVIAAGYVLSWRPRLRAATDRAATELATLRANAPLPHDVAAAYETVDRLRAAIDDERLRQRSLDSANATNPIGEPVGPQGSLAAVLTRNHLVVLDERLAAGPDGDAASTARTVRLAGAYGDVTRALDELARASGSERVFGIAMQLSTEGGAPTWTLTFR